MTRNPLKKNQRPPANKMARAPEGSELPRIGLVREIVLQETGRRNARGRTNGKPFWCKKARAVLRFRSGQEWHPPEQPSSFGQRFGHCPCLLDHLRPFGLAVAVRSRRCHMLPS